MHRLARTIAKYLPQRRAPRQAAWRRLARPRLEALEDRSLLDAGTTGTISGVAFVDANRDGVREANEAVLSGTPLTLTGTTNQGAPASTSVTTDANGGYQFLNVVPGTYQITGGPVSFLDGINPGSSGAATGTTVVPGLTLGAGQSLSADVAFLGLAPQAVTLQMFLASTTTADFPSLPAGTGQGFVNSRANSPPFVSSPIAAVAVAVNASPTMIDLAGNFSDPDISDTMLTINTSDGPLNIELFDKQAPRTVANFMNYVTSGRFDSSIFHRLVTSPTPFVLQGGGFTFSNDGTTTTLTPIPTDPAVQNEHSLSNTQGTLAMALAGTDANSATDEFFINLSNNTSLDTANARGGPFTVFGKIVGPADQAVLNLLASTPMTDQSRGDPNSPFGQVPLNNYTGTNFPSDANASNFLLVQNVVIDSRPEVLTYSVVGNTNPALVTPAVNNERLTLNYTPGLTGSAVITVQATDTFGATVQTSFTVTVG
jgi:cyclophilin family peptidyl-prolyl cis-trans isomerase